MRAMAMAFAVVSAALASGATAAPQDDFAALVAGPWGRVDINWAPYTGVLAKNSCPLAGVRGPTTIGLFGDGGTMWIEAGEKAELKLHDGNRIARTLQFVRMETGTSAVYREGTTERRLSLAAHDRLSEERLPPIGAQPPTKYLRCKTKK